MTVEQDIRFERRNGLAVVTLNRPKALNALTLEMCRVYDAQLADWAKDPAVAAVLIKGEGERAFCAGGDVRAIWEGVRDGGDLPAAFFAAEYRMNRRIFHFPKPYIALIDGITMGGGVGVSIHGSHRIATENTLFAMPETGIGLFPDVGATYALPRLPGKLGLYLGLTGARLKAADCLYAGIATHFVPRDRLDDLETALAETDWGGEPAQAADRAINAVAGDPGPASLAAHRDTIDRCFADESVDAILAALMAEGDDWAAKTRADLLTRSPTSLRVSLRAIRDGARLAFDEAMTVEYRLSQACMAGHDFSEGVRALIIDKDNAPQWRPSSLAEVSDQAVETYFQPPGAGDLVFR